MTLDEACRIVDRMNLGDTDEATAIQIEPSEREAIEIVLHVATPLAKLAEALTMAS